MSEDSPSARRAESPLAIQIGALLAASLAAALLIALRLPDRPAAVSRAAGPARVTLAEAVRASASVLWVDARSDAEYKAGHIPRAIPVNEDDWDAGLGRLVMAWRPDAIVVVYCTSDRCDTADRVARQLRADLGTGDIRVLAGGWEAWRAHNG